MADKNLSKHISSPEQCVDMMQVRAGVDATDLELMRLLDRRFAYMRAAARLKESRTDVRDEERKRVVIAAAVAEAQKLDLPALTIAAMWELLVEASIDYELAYWDRIRF